MTHADALVVLGIWETTWPSVAEVKTAFRYRAKQTHPDKFPENKKAGANAYFIRLKAAYDLALAEAGKPKPPPDSGPFDPMDAIGFGLCFSMGDFQDAYNRLRQPKKPRTPKPRVADARPRRKAQRQSL